MALPRDGHQSIAVEEQVLPRVEVTAGDHHGSGAQRVDCTGQGLGVGARAIALAYRTSGHQLAGLGEVGRNHGGPWHQTLHERSPRVRLEQHRSLSATITGSRTTGAPARSSSAVSTASIVATSPSIPIFTASTPMSSTIARTCSTIVSGGTG